MKQSTWRGEGRRKRRGDASPSSLSLSLSSTRCIASLFFRCIERTSSLFDRMQSSLERGIEGRVLERRTFDLVNSFSNGTEEDDTRVSVPLSFSLSLPVLSSFSSFLSSFASSSSPFFSLFFRLFLPFRPATDVEWGSTMRGNRASGEFLLTAFETSRRGTLETDVWSIRDSFHILDVSSTLNLNRESDKGRVYRAFYFRDSMKLRTLIYWNV